VKHILLYCVRLVSGSGDIKLTKDGNVLLHEMVKHHWESCTCSWMCWIRAGASHCK